MGEGTVDTLFDAIDTNRRGRINQGDLRVFLQSNGKELQPAELEAFLAARNGMADIDMNSTQDATLDRAALTRAVRVYYKVAKPSVISDERAEGEHLRQMDAGEVLEVLEGPKTDE